MINLSSLVTVNFIHPYHSSQSIGGLKEGVTKADAEVLCAARGGHLVDMDESRGPVKNNAIKALLSDVVPSEPGRPGMQ